jgi:DNA adenine methylase
LKPLYIWAGGKNKMIPKYIQSPGIPTSGYDAFVEPFFGGGAMMLWVKENCPDVKHFVMNDINPEIVGIYHAIKNDVNCFVDRMEQLSAQYLPLIKEDRKKFYYDLREEYTQRWNQWNKTEESATLYFLMKTGFNGIWQINQKSNGRFATPSGLLNQKDKVYDRWNVDEWHVFLQNVDIRCGDWQQSCKQIPGQCAFYFMDPPYRDSFTQYGQTFDDQAHLNLINFCATQDTMGDFVFYCNREAGDDFYTKNKQQLALNNYSIT